MTEIPLQITDAVTRSITKSTRNWKRVLKIIIIVSVLFTSALIGYWFAGGFSEDNASETMYNTRFENYIDANIDRLRLELECAVEQSFKDLEMLESVIEHINTESIKLDERLQKIIDYKDGLNEAESIIGTINNNLDRFRPSD